MNIIIMWTPVPMNFIISLLIHQSSCLRWQQTINITRKHQNKVKCKCMTAVTSYIMLDEPE